VSDHEDVERSQAHWRLGSCLLTAVLELAGNHTHNSKRKRVTPEDVVLSIRSDDELSKLCGSIAVYTGGRGCVMH